MLGSNRLALACWLGAALLGAACGDDAAPSAAADAGLVMDAGGGAMDTGTPPDARTATDTGTVPDTGTAPDAGTATDTGTAPDTGAAIDSGPPPDAGNLCGFLGAYCADTEGCGDSGYECTLGDFCAPARTLCGGFAGAECTDPETDCYYVTGSSAGVCLKEDELACACAQSPGALDDCLPPEE